MKNYVTWTVFLSTTYWTNYAIICKQLESTTCYMDLIRNKQQVSGTCEIFMRLNDFLGASIIDYILCAFMCFMCLVKFYVTQKLSKLFLWKSCHNLFYFFFEFPIIKSEPWNGWKLFEPNKYSIFNRIPE